MKNLTLDNSLLLGKGHERLCYIHPDDATKVIKIGHKKTRNQNEIESIYYRYLARTNADLSHIIRCYGYVCANNNRGLVFDRVMNSDLSQPLTFDEAIKTKAVSKDYAKALLADLKAYLEKNCIIFADIGLGNILCPKQANGEYKLVIVDGLGARRLGLKLWLSTHIPLYARYRIKSQWKKIEDKFAQVP
jgi:hypothetical protein